MTFMFNAALWHDECIIEAFIQAGELSPAARDMEASEALDQARSANAIDEDHGSDEWPISLSPQERDEHEDGSCDRCLRLLEDDPPCDAPDPQGREHYACVYKLHHTGFPEHRFEPTDDHWSVKTGD